jgi:hypothetical protein
MIELIREHGWPISWATWAEMSRFRERDMLTDVRLLFRLMGVLGEEYGDENVCLVVAMIDAWRDRKGAR